MRQSGLVFQNAIAFSQVCSVPDSMQCSSAIEFRTATDVLSTCPPSVSHFFLLIRVNAATLNSWIASRVFLRTPIDRRRVSEGSLRYFF